MSRVAARLVPAVDCRDVLQESLVVAWRRRETFDPERASLRTWLIQLTVDQSRKSWRRSRLARDRNASGQAVPFESADLSAARRIDLERAIAGLSDRQRLAVQLHYFVGLPVTEVAVAMKCAEGTVKSTLADARKRLERLLGKDYY
jgi:RNA polymerase sigma factor (sigma-70 family)